MFVLAIIIGTSNYCASFKLAAAHKRMFTFRAWGLGDITKYGKFTKADGLPWCGSFVNWCAAQAGVKIHSVVSTAIGAHKFKETNRWSNLPSLGALAFMDFPHDGVDRISHIGIVIDFEHGSDVVTALKAIRAAQAISEMVAW